MTTLSARDRGHVSAPPRHGQGTMTQNGDVDCDASGRPLERGKTNYYVNPQTYAPIERDTFGNDSPNDVRVHFSTYETLPLAGNQ